MAEKKVAIVMGSKSDLETMSAATTQLDEFGIGYELYVLSAHRTPDAVVELAETAEEKGIELFIAGAGKAAHLAGVIAAKTILPVIGCPMETKVSGGLDSLLSMVQMPRGVPVATMGTGKSGALNAGILAAQILARRDPDLRERVVQHKADMAAAVEATNAEVRAELGLE
jgi:5-(carboxyamino)imidazole ribonucleotide mutase